MSGPGPGPTAAPDADFAPRADAPWALHPRRTAATGGPARTKGRPEMIAIDHTTPETAEPIRYMVVLYAADGQRPTRIEIPAPHALDSQPAQAAYLDLEATWEDAEWQ